MATSCEIFLYYTLMTVRFLPNRRLILREKPFLPASFPSKKKPDAGLTTASG
jgi:hypothetical protein